MQNNQKTKQSPLEEKSKTFDTRGHKKAEAKNASAFENYSNSENIETEEKESKTEFSGADLGIHFMLCTILSLVAGIYLDKHFETLPLFTLIGLVLGFATGMWKLFQSMKD